MLIKRSEDEKLLLWGPSQGQTCNGRSERKLEGWDISVREVNRFVVNIEYSMILKKYIKAYKL